MTDTILFAPDHLSKYMGIFHNVQNDPYMYLLEIKPCGFESRIRGVCS